MLQALVKKGLNVISGTLKRQRARRPIARLVSSESPKLKAIGVALHEALEGEFSPEERALMDMIERRRATLLSSNREIEVIDFGAGAPDSNRTKEQMMAGVPSRAKVANISKVSKPYFWAVLLFKLIRELKPESCVELGSCVGISAAYQAAALSMNGRGKLVTLEGSPEISDIARDTLAGMNLQNASVVTGPFHKTLGDVLESSGVIDFFFNDGHHDHDAVIQYFNDVFPYLSSDAVIVFDDISWSPGMRRAWREIENDKRVKVSIDLRSIGIVLIGESPGNKGKIRIPL